MRLYHTGVGIVAIATLFAAGCVSVGSKEQIDPAKCGNGEIDTAESCDPDIESGEGSCPTECSQTGNACGGTVQLEGEADECTARCVVTGVACGPTDGCCPSGCSQASDGDCPLDCDAPENAGLVKCMSSSEEEAFCGGIEAKTHTCSNGETVEIDPQDGCIGFADAFPPSCRMTVDEFRACLNNPCAITEGGNVCQPLVECISDDVEEREPEPVPG